MAMQPVATRSARQRFQTGRSHRQITGGSPVRAARPEECKMELIVVLLAFIALDFAALKWGVDSTPRPSDVFGKRIGD